MDTAIRYSIDFKKLLIALKQLTKEEVGRDIQIRDTEGNPVYHSMPEFRSRMRLVRGRHGLPGSNEGPAQ